MRQCKSKPYKKFIYMEIYMSFIYKITNQINGKSYIGKTNLPSIQERFKEHIQDSKRTRMEKRPLYPAMNKYGCENFKIEQIEECSPDEVEEREKYWIEYYNTHKCGYNATLGGDGKQLYNYNIFIEEYKNGISIRKIAEKYNCTAETVRNALYSSGIKIISGQEWAKIKNSKPVLATDKKTSETFEFPSQRDAARWIKNKKLLEIDITSISTQISRACKREGSAYGYLWKHVEI